MINDLKDLKHLFKLCRQQGVTEIKLGDVAITFGDLPPQAGSSSSAEYIQDPENPYSNFPQGELTLEQLAFYSAGGTPDEDPVLKDAASV